MKEEFDATFRCNQNIDWHVKLTMSKVIKFCGVRKLNIEQISPSTLDEQALMELLFIGIQHHAQAKTMILDEFLDINLVGETYTKAKEAIMYAIVNFTLPRLPENERVKAAVSIRKTVSAKKRKK